MDRLTAAGLVGGEDVDEAARPDDDERAVERPDPGQLLDRLLGGLGAEGDEAVDVELASLGRCGDGLEPGDAVGREPGEVGERRQRRRGGEGP